MFCNQCQETASNRGCNRQGLCGKSQETADAQDVLLQAAKAASAVAVRLRKDKQEVPAEANAQIRGALVATMTNMNFDEEDIAERIERILALRDELLVQVESEHRELLPEIALFTAEQENMAELAKTCGPQAAEGEDEDVQSLRLLVTAGLKGIASFLAQAAELSAESEEIDDFLQRALVDTANGAMTGGNLLALVMETGRYALRAMELLDEANTKAFGQPEITEVGSDMRGKPGILVSGSSLADLAQVLEQTKEAGVDVYTHAELLAAHAYPEFKKYTHLAGHFGGSFWQQKEDFREFNGPVLVSEALVPPKEDVADRITLTGDARYPGLARIEADAEGNKDFTALIERAKSAAAPAKQERGSLATGAAHGNLDALLEALAGAVADGAVTKILVMAGEDGRAKTRGYYTDLAKRMPETAIILTAGSAAERFQGLDLGEIRGIPRLLNAGQIGDVYSIIQALMKLQTLLGKEELKDLPVAFDLAWYGQKSIAALLALLYLDIHGILLGPTLPAFLAPGVQDVLGKYFGLRAAGTVDGDLERLFGRQVDAIRGDMIVADIVNEYPQLVSVMLGEGLHCISCGVSSMETLEEACQVHGLDTADIIELLNDTLAHSA